MKQVYFFSFLTLLSGSSLLLATLLGHGLAFQSRASVPRAHFTTPAKSTSHPRGSFPVQPQPSRRQRLSLVSLAASASSDASRPSPAKEANDPTQRFQLLLSDPREVPGPIIPSDDNTNPPFLTNSHQRLPSRAEQVRRLQSSSSNNNDEYDVLVIGGGAVGSGIALDAAARGLQVACIEKGDFASETSSRSTKLIWAGIKYLATAFAAVLTPQNWKKDPRGTWTEFWQEFQMVLSCHAERKYMLEKQSHLSYWLAIAVPFEEWIVNDPPPFGHPLFALFPLLAPLVFAFYDALSQFSCPPSYIMTNAMARDKFPQLQSQDPVHSSIKYSMVFYEGHHNDARTNLAIALTAAAKGAHMGNYIEMVDLIHDGTEEDINTNKPNSSSTKVLGARCLDRMTGQVFEVRAKNVVLAGGPFTDRLRQKEVQQQSLEGRSASSMTNDDINDNDETTASGQKQVETAVEAAWGTHIVVPGHFIPKDMGLLDYQTSDGRFLFIAPWQGHTLIGTTDKKGPAQSLHMPPEEDIQWLVNEAQKYLRKDRPIRRTDVLSAWRGWRPLASDPHHNNKGNDKNNGDGPQQEQVSRDHVISENPETGVIFVAGGKWTTWREMAQDVTDHIVGERGPRCTTRDIVLWGGQGYSNDLPERLEKDYGLDRDIAQHLVATYGGCAIQVADIYRTQNCQRLVDGFPYLQAEVLYACREYACTIEDILSRRTRLAYLNKERALEALPIVADLLAEELEWSYSALKNQINFALLYLGSFAGREPASIDTAPAKENTSTSNEELRSRSYAFEDIRNSNLLEATRNVTFGLEEVRNVTRV